MKYTICHLTVAHQANDARILAKECESLARNDNYKVILCAPGNILSKSKILHYKLPDASASRLKRFVFSQFIGLKSICHIKADVWHIHDLELLPVACSLILLRKKVIWDSHEDYFNQFGSQVNYRSYIPKYLRPLARFIVFFFLKYIDKNASAIIAPTQNVSAKYSNSNLSLVGNEAILEEFYLCNPKFKSNNVLFIGSPSPASCFKEIVDAIARIPELRLVVASQHFSKVQLDYSIEKLNSKFEYKGWLDRKDLAEAISKSLIGLVTYSQNKNHHDNQPTKFYEFCAAGLPILATPTPFNNELIKLSKAGVLSRDYGSDSIMAGLKELISSKQKWLGYSTSGKVWSINSGNWAKSEAELLRAYSSILS